MGILSEDVCVRGIMGVSLRVVIFAWKHGFGSKNNNFSEIFPSYYSACTYDKLFKVSDAL